MLPWTWLSIELIFPAGVHYTRISRVAYTLSGHTPPSLSDTPESILRAQQRGHRRSNPKYKGTLGPQSSVLLRGTWLAGEADPPPTTGVRWSNPGAGRGKAGV